MVRILARGPIPDGSLKNALLLGITSEKVPEMRWYSISAAGIAKLTCCKMSPVLTSALNAVVEPRLTHPKRKTQPQLASKAQTGTSHLGCTRDMYFDRTTALSRAKHQVSLEEVCCAPVIANKVMRRRTMEKKVATALDEVAW